MVTGSARDAHCTWLFQVDGNDVAMVADPSHLEKAMRNALYNNGECTFHEEHVADMGLPGNTVKWCHIQKAFEFDESKELKVFPHLKRAFLFDIGNFLKMKVPPARLVLSRDTG